MVTLNHAPLPELGAPPARPAHDQQATCLTATLRRQGVIMPLIAPALRHASGFQQIEAVLWRR